MDSILLNSIPQVPASALNFVFIALFDLLFLSLRIGAFLIAAPFFGSRMVPLNVRIILIFSLAIFLQGWIAAPDFTNVAASVLILTILVEIALGLTAGFVFAIAFATVSVAGEKIAATSGLSFAMQVDPATGTQSPIVSQFLTLFILSNYYVFVPLSKVFREKYLKSLENKYSKLLSYLLLRRRPYFVLLGSILLLIGTFQLLQIYPPKILFFPENRPNYINVFLELPVGTDIEETNNFAKIIEEEVNKSTSEYSSIIESVVTYVGQRTLNENDPSALGMRDTPNRARININFYEFEKRNGINTIDVLEKLRNDINDYPGVSITYGKDRKGPPVGGEISIQVTGPDFQELISQVENMRKYINDSNIPGIEKLGLDLSTR